MHTHTPGNLPGRETKIFDPHDPDCGTNGAELLDATVVKRGDRSWMYLAGQAHGYGAPLIYSASLPAGAPLAAAGWTITRDRDEEVVPLTGQESSMQWDLKGGRHCPCYVKGIDPGTGQFVERIYYAGAAENIWGPYTIGFLEWNGNHWIDQPEPVFIATQDWEHCSVYEPNLVYDEGKWKMWYVAGSNMDDYLIHGYSESLDGRTNWTEPRIFAPPEMKMFDFCVRRRDNGCEAVFSRVWVTQTAPPPETGLWWCRAEKSFSSLAQWSEPQQIMTAEDKGWHVGPWKPSLAFDDSVPSRIFVFFDGLYKTSDPGPFPFAFTLGCLELERPLDTL
jgi:hypothetical protein